MGETLCAAGAGELVSRHIISCWHALYECAPVNMLGTAMRFHDSPAKNAIDALASLAEPSSVPFLLTLAISHPDPGVRRNATYALAATYERGSAAARKMVQTRTGAVRAIASNAAETIDHRAQALRILWLCQELDSMAAARELQPWVVAGSSYPFTEAPLSHT